MHPEKSQLFTTVILTGSRWKCLDMACASFHLFSNKVWTWVQSETQRRGWVLGPCPRSRHIHCWRSRCSLPYSTHTKGGREIFKIFEERNMPTCPAVIADKAEKRKWRKEQRWQKRGWHFFANQRVKYLIPVTRAQYHNCLISDGHWDWKLWKVCHS